MARPPAHAATEAGEQALRQQIDALDISLLAGIPSQTKGGDRASLLALHAAAAERFGSFVYLEIGSHLGGSLQAVVRDPRCRDIVSIDPRPELTPDDRGKNIPYRGNSTERMLERLRKLPGVDLDKLRTFESDTHSLSPRDIGATPDVCFIDGEHTHDSALTDARFCRTAIGASGVIAFHDLPIIHGAAWQFVRELRRDGVACRAYPLPDTLFVVEVGGTGLHGTRAMRSYLGGRGAAALAPLARPLARRPSAGGRGAEALLRLWLWSDSKRVRKYVKVRRRRLARRAARARRRARGVLSR